MMDFRNVFSHVLSQFVPMYVLVLVAELGTSESLRRVERKYEASAIKLARAVLSRSLIRFVLVRASTRVVRISRSSSQ
jgi:hypothetical protein